MVSKLTLKFLCLDKIPNHLTFTTLILFISCHCGGGIDYTIPSLSPTRYVSEENTVFDTSNICKDIQIARPYPEHDCEWFEQDSSRCEMYGDEFFYEISSRLMPASYICCSKFEFLIFILFENNIHMKFQFVGVELATVLIFRIGLMRILKRLILARTTKSLRNAPYTVMDT